MDGHHVPTNWSHVQTSRVNGMNLRYRKIFSSRVFYFRTVNTIKEYDKSRGI